MLKKGIVVILSLGLVLAFSFSSQSDAASGVKLYKNCTEMNKDYKGGVARAANVKNKGGKTFFKPFVSQALYDLNKSEDRDKDFIACEK